MPMTTPSSSRVSASQVSVPQTRYAPNGLAVSSGREAMKPSRFHVGRAR
jgi:hypothetical protein